MIDDEEKIDPQDEIEPEDEETDEIDLDDEDGEGETCIECGAWIDENGLCDCDEDIDED